MKTKKTASAPRFGWVLALSLIVSAAASATGAGAAVQASIATYVAAPLAAVMQSAGIHPLTPPHQAALPPPTSPVRISCSSLASDQCIEGDCDDGWKCISRTIDGTARCSCEKPPMPLPPGMKPWPSQSNATSPTSLVPGGDPPVTEPQLPPPTTLPPPPPVHAANGMSIPSTYSAPMAAHGDSTNSAGHTLTGIPLAPLLPAIPQPFLPPAQPSGPAPNPGGLTATEKWSANCSQMDKNFLLHMTAGQFAVLKDIVAQEPAGTFGPLMHAVSCAADSVVPFPAPTAGAGHSK